ncbi:hypothetical protein DXG01_012059 [Tephrocybe rancida]|nr:hypothetical protein DXG01_012059 [Tephrocybe rancida]
MRFLNFEAVVEVDGVALPEYEVKYDDKANSATCWIPSEAGKDLSDYRQTSTILNNPVHRFHPTVSSARQPLMLTILDDEASTNFPPTKSLGNIVVKMYHVELGKSSTHDGVRDTLRADGIAPPDPAVRDHSKGKRKAAELDVKEEKASDDDAEESDSDEEENTIFKGLLDALHKLEEKRAKKKAAKAKSQSTSSKKIKTEPKARPLRASVTEVIDLT